MKEEEGEALWNRKKMKNIVLDKNPSSERDQGHSSGAVWESRWTSWAVRPNKPSGFRGPCFGIGHNLSLICQLTSEDIKQHFTTETKSGSIDRAGLHCVGSTLVVGKMRQQ